MVDKIYIMPSGKIATQDGKPVVLSQSDFEDCCCASGAPCTDCSGAQDPATITVAGTCSSQSLCDSAQGDYDWNIFTDSTPTTCYWNWEHEDRGETPPNNTTLTIWYYPGTGLWDVYITGNGNAFWDSGALAFSCVGGKITGTAVSVPGIDACAGCTATLTVG